MTRGMGVREQKLEKQMGCMAGFLHIFDRHQVFAGKRIDSAKRLPPSAPPETHSSPERASEGGSPAESETTTQATKSPLPHPVLEFKENKRSFQKFSREAPRLSLDSRAILDAKGTFHPEEKQRRSTSVVARLMGLEDDSDPELRRSASESRASRRDLPQQQYRFFDTTNFQLKRFHRNGDSKASDPNTKTEPNRGMIRQKKSFFDSADFFPAGPKQCVSGYGEIERKLKMRGIDEPSKDLETLKQILEALQLKGLLHSKKSTLPLNQRNFVFDGTVFRNDSPIVVMKPAMSPGSLNRTGWTGSNSPPPSTFRSSPRARPETDSNTRAQSQPRGRSPSSPTRSPNRTRKLTNAEPQRKVNECVDRRRTTPVHSTPLGSRRNGPDRSPRLRKAINDQKEKAMLMGVATAEDELSTVSDSSFSTSSYTDTERYKMEDQYREGKNLLQRCDKLLNSIAEITAGGTELQPSPVSVLDSSFFKDESSCSPSPVMKRCIDYKDQAAESEDDTWSAALCCSEAKSEDCDFVYVSEILRASDYLPEDSDVFLLLEKQQCLKGNDTSKASTLRRRLIFDTIHEILNRNRRLPPWKAENSPPLNRIWSEFRRIRETEVSEDLFEVICGLLRKDIAENNEWGECPMEIGDMVLDIERFIFKDLIGETIQHLASFKGQRNKVSTLRRKLVF